MKTVVASLVTALVVVGGAHAYDSATASSSQVTSLQARVAALEAFDRNCLKAFHIRLTENSDGVMVWGIGVPTPHAGRFYGIPDTAVAPLYCG